MATPSSSTPHGQSAPRRRTCYTTSPFAATRQHVLFQHGQPRGGWGEPDEAVPRVLLLLSLDGNDARFLPFPQPGPAWALSAVSSARPMPMHNAT